jgi:L-ascorbate metabolism protein UlaG (beta-lactamase superfamily)
MEITWIGHSCFKLRGKTGTLVTDPFDDSVGLPFPKISADIVTVSHAHGDHYAVVRVSGTARRPKPFVITEPGEYEATEIGVFGFPSFHDDRGGLERGGNLITVIHMDGVTFSHLGDLGHLLSDKQVLALDGVDVLFVPVGGAYTIDAKQAAEVVEAIKPSIVVPMHYKLPRMREAFGQLESVETFLKQMGKEGVVPVEKLTVTPESLPDELGVVVLRAGAVVS